MLTKDSIAAGLAQMRQQYGEWAYDIPLPFDNWTRGRLNLPHTRIKRVLQIISDLVGKPLSDCRILDLGCLDGQFSIECAAQGATTVGVEIREASIKKAIFCRDVLALSKLDFRQDDARNVSVERYGHFDAVICSGLFYHLTAGDAIRLLQQVYRLSLRLVLLDTHVALHPTTRVVHDSLDYWGTTYLEHPEGITQQQRERRVLASWDNSASFWFTRPSLINLLQTTGFSSVYECFTPAHLNFGKPGIEHRDRCTLVAIKCPPCTLVTSPAANGLNERWPEESLSYAPPPKAKVLQRGYEGLRRLLKRISRAFARVVGPTS